MKAFFEDAFHISCFFSLSMCYYVGVICFHNI